MKEKETFIPIEDVAEHFAVSVATIRTWIRKGHISSGTFIKAGSTYRFRLSDVIDTLLSNGAELDPTQEGAVVRVRGSQAHAEASVAGYVQMKESLANDFVSPEPEEEITSAEVENMFGEDS
jgi:excisionase family DNA binding protein